MVCESDGQYTLDILTDDALLHIFSYLNILDRSIAARVSRRWNCLAKQGELWRNVNLNNGIHTYSETSQSYYILSYQEAAILNLINNYLGPCLRHIQFHIPVTNKILRLLALRCPNLEMIDIQGDPSKVDLSLISCKLITIYLHLPLESVKRSPIGKFALFPLFRLENFYLQHGQVTDKLLCRLMQSYNLHSVAFEGCHWQLKPYKIALMSLCLPELTHLELVSCQFPSYRFLNRLVHHVATKCTHLESFILIQPSSMDGAPADCSSLIIEICDQKNLRHLQLGGIHGLTVEAVVLMSHSLPNLTDIGFIHCHVTNDIMKEISHGFPNLISLDITGSKCLSNIGLKHLQKHANIEILKLASCENLSCDVIVDTVLTLPKLHTLVLPDTTNYESCVEILTSKKPKLDILNAGLLNP
ncbi:F-box and leucine-rich repeat protein 13-like [Amphiura filiformis]|uniref:F-box and leucine-rich repeat protein 13-like n=1 Tax=Amphiura filiformis TaxID=82378 RepID=UPI003B20DE9F